MDRVRRLVRNRVAIAAALVTLLTFGVVTAVVLTTTSLGCSLKVKTTRCLTVASISSPSPFPSTKGGYIPPPSPITPINPGQSPPQPYDPGASSPYNPGYSSNPPYNPGASAGYPYPNPASGSYPPLPYPASGSAGPNLGFSCRLPVYAYGPGSGGFIVFPGASFVADPRSAVSAPSPSPGGPSPTPPQYGPGYTGWWGSTYDAAFSKWLPVPYAWVSPDGAHYAYPLNGDIYVQSVAGGPQLDLGEGQRYSVVDVENNGVYVTTQTTGGLWFLPFNGAAKQMATTGFWQGVSHGAAYGTPTSSVPQGASNEILKLDLNTGTSSQFFSWPGAQSYVMGFDLQGRPVIQVSYQGGVAIFVVTGPTSYSTIAAQTYGPYQQNPPFPQGLPVADSHGLWFSVGSGVDLYANGQWYPMSNVGGNLAGQCI